MAINPFRNVRPAPVAPRATEPERESMPPATRQGGAWPMPPEIPPARKSNVILRTPALFPPRIEEDPVDYDADSDK